MSATGILLRNCDSQPCLMHVTDDKYFRDCDDEEDMKGMQFLFFFHCSRSCSSTREQTMRMPRLEDWKKVKRERERK